MSNAGVQERRRHLDEQTAVWLVPSGNQMTDIESKRAWVEDMYPGPRWKAKVRKMSDAQVVAIYMREHNNPHKPKPPKESNDDPPPF